MGSIHKPEFVTHPERYFSERPARGKRASALPPLATTAESKYCVIRCSCSSFCTLDIFFVCFVKVKSAPVMVVFLATLIKIFKIHIHNMLK